MIKCYECKYSMIPKQNILNIKLVCINPKVRKGIVQSNYKCKDGEKR